MRLFQEYREQIHKNSSRLTLNEVKTNRTYMSGIDDDKLIVNQDFNNYYKKDKIISKYKPQPYIDTN